MYNYLLCFPVFLHMYNYLLCFPVFLHMYNLHPDFPVRRQMSELIHFLCYLFRVRSQFLRANYLNEYLRCRLHQGYSGLHGVQSHPCLPQYTPIRYHPDHRLLHLRIANPNHHRKMLRRMLRRSAFVLNQHEMPLYPHPAHLTPQERLRYHPKKQVYCLSK